MDIQTYISQHTGFSTKSIINTIKLLEEGATIPFISRYRKELTGNLNEVEIADIQKNAQVFANILQRKAHILKTIAEQNKLDDDLRTSIEQSYNLTDLEDLFLPYKSSRKTKADTARENGLEPLAKMIMAQNSEDVEGMAKRFRSEHIKTNAEAISGAMDIVMQWINENTSTRNRLRQVFNRSAVLTSKLGKNENEKYQNYKDWAEPLKKCSSHRFLAMYRADKEGALKIHALPEEDEALRMMERYYIKGRGASSEIVRKAMVDAYRKLLRPSLENELLQQAKEKADKQAIQVFQENLRQLLMAPPLGAQRTLGIDPGYRTGCKVVALDQHGHLLANSTIYPHKPKEEKKIAYKRIASMVEQYQIDAIAIGNGTAGRETEFFIKKIKFNRPVRVFVVSEDGASIYSASKIGRAEFPDYDVTVRGAVSIARRLMDPLSELVKIEPKSLGVGQYQHEVNQKQLQESLNFVVESVVNAIGVNLNTASPYLLQYVSGLNLNTAQKIVDYRTQNGAFLQREDLLKVSGIGEKTYEQAIGFLRIPKAKNPLDNSRVHPEHYPIVEQMAKGLQVKKEELIGNEALISKIDIEQYITPNTGIYTLNDIVSELKKKGLDPRKATKVLEFDEHIRTINDLKEGMVLPGIVTNITNFGAFVDVGIKENGLIHISEMADEFVDNPNEHVKLHQHLKVRVASVDAERKRIQLSLKGI